MPIAGILPSGCLFWTGKQFPLKYLRGESNPYLKFRKLLFYPLNYRGIAYVSLMLSLP